MDAGRHPHHLRLDNSHLLLTEQRIDQSVRRILKLKRQMGR